MSFISLKWKRHDFWDNCLLFENHTLFFLGTVLRSKKRGESLKKLQKKWQHPRKRLFYQRYCPGNRYLKSTTQMSLTYLVKPCNLKLCILKSNVAQVENIAKMASLKWLHLTPLERKYQCLWLISLPNEDVLSMYEIFLVNTKPKQKA